MGKALAFAVLFALIAAIFASADLEAASISAPSRANSGARFSGTFAITNAGDEKSAATDARVTVGGKTAALVIVQPLLPGEKAEFGFSGTCSGAGTLAIVATADAKEAIAEPDERNNVREIGIWCIGGDEGQAGGGNDIGPVQKQGSRSSGIFNAIGLGEIDRAVEGFFKWLFGR